MIGRCPVRWPTTPRDKPRSARLQALALLAAISFSGLLPTMPGGTGSGWFAPPGSAEAATASSSLRGRRRRKGRRSPVVLAVERAAPSVVNISTLQVRRKANPFSQMKNPLTDYFFRDFFGGRTRKRREQSLGSGVIIRADGYILTNEHVISRATKILVHLSGDNVYPARIIGSDPVNDLAIIKIDADIALPYLPMGRSGDLMIGESVIAIGNPFGLQHTVTTGVVSALGRSLNEKGRNQGRNPTDFIQTDASINPGNSGGPLLNVFGELIGVNTAIFSKAQGIGFAIPINRARRIVDDLIHFGKVRKAWVGIVLQDLTPRLAARVGYRPGQGTIAAQVLGGSPADKAGIRRGDILVDFGGKKIASREDYLNELSGYTVGSEVGVRFWREGKVKETRIRFSAIPVALADAIAQNWLGLRVSSIDDRGVRRYSLRTRSGVVVTAVVSGGASDSIGIRPGDVIRQVNGQSIGNVESFREMVVRAREFPRVQLIVQRRNEGYNVTLEP
ncbi:MAG: serine protease Do [Nitrospinae bacterium]|nr:serine protease Do [Nitrospinota bacterium]